MSLFAQRVNFSSLQVNKIRKFVNFSNFAMSKWLITCNSTSRSQEDAQDQMKPRFTINLKGCEITPEVNISNHRYGIKLAVPSAEGMSDLWLKCDSVSSYQFSKWIFFFIKKKHFFSKVDVVFMKKRIQLQICNIGISFRIHVRLIWNFFKVFKFFGAIFGSLRSC